MPKILLAIDACSQLERLLPAALLLASQQHAELLSLFDQDNRLLQGAALPFTQEIGSNSATCYPLTTDSLEKRMRCIAEEMRHRMATAAARQQVPFEFQICCGDISQVIAEARADVVLSGWNSDLLVIKPNTGSSRRRTLEKPVIVVVDDGSQVSADVIEGAKRLISSTGTHQLVILELSAAAERHFNSSPALSGGRSGEIVIPVSSMEQLTQRIRMLHPMVMILGRDQNLAADRGLQKKLALMSCPLAMLQSTW